MGFIPDTIHTSTLKYIFITDGTTFTIQCETIIFKTQWMCITREYMYRHICIWSAMNKSGQDGWPWEKPTFKIMFVLDKNVLCLVDIITSCIHIHLGTSIFQIIWNSLLINPLYDQRQLTDQWLFIPPWHRLAVFIVWLFLKGLSLIISSTLLHLYKLHLWRNTGWCASILWRRIGIRIRHWPHLRWPWPHREYEAQYQVVSLPLLYLQVVSFYM